MKGISRRVRDLISTLDAGVITECDFVKQIVDLPSYVDWKEWNTERAKELEEATITLVHLVCKDNASIQSVIYSIEKLREACYKVSHEEDGTFYCISPKDAWGAVHRTEGKDPRFLIDVRNSLN